MGVACGLNAGEEISMHDFVGETRTTGLFRSPRRRWEVQGNHKEITLYDVQRIRLDKRWSLYERQGTFGFDNVRGIKTRLEATSRFKKKSSTARS